MTRAPATKRIEAKAATRAKVLAAAHELFDHRGFEAVHIRDIAAKAGLSTGSVFSNFVGKAELFEAAMGEPAPDVVAFLERVAAVVPDTLLATDAERLRRHLIGHHA